MKRIAHFVWVEGGIEARDDLSLLQLVDPVFNGLPRLLYDFSEGCEWNAAVLIEFREDFSVRLIKLNPCYIYHF